VIGRIVRSIDFERVLGAATQARSAHFAVHHLSAAPSRPAGPAQGTDPVELSTGDAPKRAISVDDLSRAGPSKSLWFGAVVPKRHASRAVTRSLLKRQIRAAVLRHGELAAGLWVVRLRAPFERAEFKSAASCALRETARAELDAVLAAAVRRQTPA